MSQVRRVDLLVLVADQDMEFTFQGIFNRPESFNIQEFSFRIIRHDGHDPGCRTNAEEYLRPFTKQFKYALVVFDKEGSGAADMRPIALEDDLRQRLAATGWSDRADVLVIDPELEIWLFSDSPEVDRILGWTESAESLRGWLRSQNLLEDRTSKPRNPKATLRKILHRTGKRPSASIFKNLAEKVSLQNCQDPAFGRLRAILQKWFPRLRP